MVGIRRDDGGNKAEMEGEKRMKEGRGRGEKKGRLMD